MKKIIWRLLFVWIVWSWSIRGMRKLTWWNILEEYFWDDTAIVVAWDEDHPHDGTEWDDHHNDNTNNTINNKDWVLVVSPKFITQDELSEKTYVGNVYSPYYGQVYAFREWLIEELFVDVWDTVKKWQKLWTLTQQTFSPELASMEAEKKWYGEGRGGCGQISCEVASAEQWKALSMMTAGGGTAGQGRSRWSDRPSGHAIARACGPSSQSADRGSPVQQQLGVTTAAEGPRRADDVPFLIHLTT